LKISKSYFFSSGNGVTVPTGSQIAVLADTLHRRTDLWGEDAASFNPDHFHPDVTHHPYSFLPFSGGPRICIGYKYAYMAMKVVMAYMLRRYKFSTELKLKDLEWDVSITLKLINKHMVTAEKRDW
jgi:cytochrome P450